MKCLLLLLLLVCVACPVQRAQFDAQLIFDANLSDRFVDDARVVPDGGLVWQDTRNADLVIPVDSTSSDTWAPLDGYTPDRVDLTDGWAPSDSAPSDRQIPDLPGIDSNSPDGAGPENTAAACSDHTDNDGDTYVDCRDWDCAGIPPCDIPEDTEQACTDGHDNDGDGYTDCRDWDCGNVSLCGVPENNATTCTNGYDDDGDGDPDCLDSECLPLSVCARLENTNAACRDNVDNDHDGNKDCADSECSALPVCDPNEDSEATCTDGVDNDGDNLRDCLDPQCSSVPSCDVTRLRVATWNIQEINGVNINSFDLSAAVVARVDADVFCLQEVRSAESSYLANLGNYPHRYQGIVSTPMAGGLTNACLSRYPIVDSRSLSSSDISSDSSANETGRDIVLVRIEVVPGSAFVGLVVNHLKSGFTAADRFRRQIESERMAQVVSDYRGQYPNDGLVVMGDINEEIDSYSLGGTIDQLPADLPFSYQLGSDLSLPIPYHPFNTFTGVGLAVVDASLEDLPSNRATRIPSGRRIDYLFYSGLTVLGSEVYDACEDNGVDDPPIGHWLPKQGTPLSCGALVDASDHRPVFVDFGLD